MKFFSWNVNGIRAVVRKGTFQKFIAEHQPDILCLQETKAERGQAEIDLPEYQEYWNSAEKKGYSGTAIFTKRQPIKVTNGFPAGFAKKFDFTDDEERDAWSEGRVITAEFEKFHAVTVYTPNAKDDLSRLDLRYRHWDPAFLEHVKLLDQQEAGHLLRRPERGAYRGGSGQSEAESRQEGFHRRGARGLPDTSSTRALSTRSASSRRAMATTRGGRTSPTPARATWDGESITCWCPRRCRRRSGRRRSTPT